ncbi:MAG: cytochrome b N-terminal domain-containing protein [Anaerolineales bacterium]
MPNTSQNTVWKKVYAWLDERLGLQAMYDNLLDRPEPLGNWWNTLGSASLFLFLLQGVTGIFLTVYYTPSPDHAYDSIQYIMEGVAFGWLIRGIHHWGATLMVLVVFIHMLRVFATASFKYPRELTWLVGIGLLLLTLGMGFTGYLLPWNQKSFFATVVGTEIAGSVPFIGEFILKSLRGGPDLSALTLQRFFAAHIWILPGLLAALIGVHLYLIIRHGESAYPDPED